MKNLFVIFCLFVSVSLFAQDKIVKHTGDTIRCEVSELGADEIKYYYNDKPNLVFGIDKALVARVEFKTGEVVTFEANSLNDPGYYVGQGKHAFKFGFMNPLYDNVELGFEQSIKPGMSWEVSLGIIGLGWDTPEMDGKGAYTKIGYKFLRSPDFYAGKLRYAHILKGGYVEPELALSVAEYDSYYSYDGGGNGRTLSMSAAFMLKFGKQWVFNDAFLVDIYFGFGYGFNTEDEVVTYGFINGTSDAPFAVTSGIRIGYVF